MSYVPWDGSYRYVTIRYDTIRYDTIRYDTIRYDTIRYGTIRYDSIRYDTICVIIGKSPYPGNIPSIPDCPKYCIIIAYTVTVLLPMRVLHGTCYSYTSGGDDQSPNVVHYCWTMV